MKKLLLILTSLLLVSVLGCGTGDSILGPGTNDQMQANDFDDSNDKTETPSSLTTGDPWDDDEGPGGGGNTFDPEDPDDPDDPDGDKDPGYDPYDPPSEP